ncbi:HlyD family secretion protein, partial [Mesorhizobium sp. LHD-90]|nr:HlyD family secretion protein [Mesorhizobium sp. LHD-90]
NADVVTRRELERLKVLADGREGAVREALASKEVLQTQIATLLPAQKASAEAALAQAQVELDRTVVRAGVTGVVQQFALRAGDVVNPMIRSAGILVPTENRRVGLVGGFLQIEAQVMKVGMIAEATCAAKPLTIIPMVVTEIQHVIASGQVRTTDQLVDVAQLARPGTITVYLEPLWPGLLDGIPPGSSCIANAYTNNHDELASPDISTGRWLYLHLIDAVGLVHALILRLQSILLPIQTLVLGDH